MIKKANSKKSKKKIKKYEEKQEITLEEEIKEAEKAIEEEIKQDFFEEPVRQIPISTEISAPVLERIIQRQVPTENEIEIEQPGRETRDERKINYSPTNEPNYSFTRNTEKEEKKYETNFVPPVLSRQEFSTDNMRREFLKPSENAWRSNEPMLDEIDILKQETRLPFEEQERKYKRFKLR